MPERTYRWSVIPVLWIAGKVITWFAGTADPVKIELNKHERAVNRLNVGVS